MAEAEWMFEQWEGEKIRTGGIGNFSESAARSLSFLTCEALCAKVRHGSRLLRRKGVGVADALGVAQTKHNTNASDPFQPDLNPLVLYI